ncbi:uncharacterized protein LOC124130918 isoform X4 [Haliotis rufescens]|uniref:uncharacterized protein LOC124130918 isoform X4 n=1 Tax=Haliotis rufescens TaxID=6454 RepID=UPI00201E7F87|nr:uncharacterized protein LOC124130918 isoform X4 [Haliotis rufescens]
MFIETLEFTIPVDLCDLFSTLKRGPRSNLEFPASVNSYGTTQDANIQVALRSNKLTFKVDGVSSNSSMISKSECKTLKLSVFDVDCSLAPAEQPNIIMSMSENIHHSVTHKRSYDFSVPVSSPAPKSRRISEPVQSRHIPQPQPQNTSRPSNNSESKSAIDPPVNVKQEPEDPDLIEIEPDSELNDIVPKKETPYMQIDFSSGVPHTQTSQAALDRLSHQQSSHSQSPASSSSSFHQNVPHVPDYAEPSTSQVHHGDQSADDFLVFQEDNDYGDDNDNEADYSNDGYSMAKSTEVKRPPLGITLNIDYPQIASNHISRQRKCINTGILGSQNTEGIDRPEVIKSEALAFETMDLNHLYDVTDQRSGRSGSDLPVQGMDCLEGSSQDKSVVYPCEECGKVFTAPHWRKRHKEANHDKKTYTCQCGREYMYRCSLLRHHRTCSLWNSAGHS